jgi:hypothetical protein
MLSGLSWSCRCVLAIASEHVQVVDCASERADCRACAASERATMLALFLAGPVACWSDVGVTWTAGAGVGLQRQKRQRPGEPEKQAGACGRSAGNGSNRRQPDCRPSRAVVVCVRCLGSCYCATGENGIASVARSSHHDGRHQRQQRRTWLGCLTAA